MLTSLKPGDSQYRSTEGDLSEIDLNFNVRSGPEILGDLPTAVFRQHIFSSFDRKFKDFKTVPPDSVRILQVGMPGLENVQVRRFLPYLMSHISQNDDILGLGTFFTDRPVAWIYHRMDRVSAEDILTLLRSPKMRVTFSNGEKKEFDNPFVVEEPFDLMVIDDLKKIHRELADKIAFIAVFQDTGVDGEE